jgi:dTDP-4-dehydrorhamnose reductase
MKFFITGGGGQLALAFQRLLKEENLPFAVYSRQELDITDITRVRKRMQEEKPDVVINCAAWNDLDSAEQNWRGAYMVNAIGPRNLAIAAEELGIPLVTFSSDYVFNGKSVRSWTIADKPDPINVYGQTKLLGEEFVKDHIRRFLIVRVSWVFGPEGREESNFLKKVLRWSREKDELKIVSDQISSPTYAPDLAERVMELLTLRAWGTYHLSCSGRCSRYEWASFALKEIGWKKNIVQAQSNEFRTLAQRPAMSSLDSFPLEEFGIFMPRWEDSTLRFLKAIGQKNGGNNNV